MRTPRAISVFVVLLSLGIGFTNARDLTLAERVKAQTAIEEVYWRHRIWPKDNPNPKPALADVMPESAIRAKVEDHLRKAHALDAVWHRPITGDQLQAELDRMARGSHDSGVLQELFDALGNDAFLIAETLVRPTLAERLVRNWSSKAAPEFDTWWSGERSKHPAEVVVPSRTYVLPALDPAGCANDTWSPTRIDVPDPRYGHTVVWTGTEMIVWGGVGPNHEFNTGGRYTPATDTWVTTSTGSGVPLWRQGHTAVWTGTEMIVWGGLHSDDVAGMRLADGGRYNPASDTWTPTSIGANTPTPRRAHTAVWTGAEMIVWGGLASSLPTSGGRYNPGTDTWSATSMGSNVPTARAGHTAIWTGSEMIVWGGGPNTGARYNPVTDQWVPTSTGANVPSARSGNTTVWTGAEMIVWGGQGSNGNLNTGGRYDPSTDSWRTTSLGAGVPSGSNLHAAVWSGSRMILSGTTANRAAIYDPVTDAWATSATNTLVNRKIHTAIWTGTEMIVWGGQLNGSDSLNTGARYDPAADSWVATSMGTVPTARLSHTAIWTGSEMIVWGGTTVSGSLTPASNIGGRYDPATDVWVPTSGGANVPTARTLHSAVWTGTEMIVWGGWNGSVTVNTGARYDPASDSWAPTSTGPNTPLNMQNHAAVWTGAEMIIWTPLAGRQGRYDPITDSWRAMAQGPDILIGRLQGVWTGTEFLVWGAKSGPGGRYDPVSNTWSAIAPAPMTPLPTEGFAEVWTGTEMIVWGGFSSTTGQYLNYGGRYDPTTDTWTQTSMGANVPEAREYPSAVWTGTEMIVWGGVVSSSKTKNSGGRYDPATDTWSSTSVGNNVPAARYYHTAIWDGAEMTVWGGDPGTATGGRYCACSSSHLVYRDADGDGYGDPGTSITICDSAPPLGYVLDATDCNDAEAGMHPGSGEACDLTDGVIFEWRKDKTSVSWQPEQGFDSWNVYVGDLDVLRAIGAYTQLPGSNALAARQCGVSVTTVADPAIPDPGKASFSLVTGVSGGDEGSLGSATGGPRTNLNPCP